jgi:pyruvate formate lyase activating enzyme
MQHPTNKPLILEIKGNTLDDGPGIRSVIFFKGCPLKCSWCHNPESKKIQTEIAFDPKLCLNCGDCRNICSKDALSLDYRCYIDRSRCDLCFECTKICPSGAISKVGTFMNIDDILNAVLSDKPFFDISGGGVTLSGGEATLFMDFASDLLRALKKHTIHTLLETCGQFDFDKFMNMIYPHVDTLYYDIKLIENTAHKKHCGIGNKRILSNLSLLTRQAEKDGKCLLPRTPLIPGITDTKTNIFGIADFLKNLGIHKAALLEYNPLWHEKSENIGDVNKYKDNKKLNHFEDGSILKKCKRIFQYAGIEVCG